MALVVHYKSKYGEPVEVIAPTGEILHIKLIKRRNSTCLLFIDDQHNFDIKSQTVVYKEKLARDENEQEATH